MPKSRLEPLFYTLLKALPSLPIQTKPRKPFVRKSLRGFSKFYKNARFCRFRCKNQLHMMLQCAISKSQNYVEYNSQSAHSFEMGNQVLHRRAQYNIMNHHLSCCCRS